MRNDTVFMLCQNFRKTTLRILLSISLFLSSAFASKIYDLFHLYIGFKGEVPFVRLLIKTNASSYDAFVYTIPNFKLFKFSNESLLQPLRFENLELRLFSSNYFAVEDSKTSFPLESYGSEQYFYDPHYYVNSPTNFYCDVTNFNVGLLKAVYSNDGISFSKFLKMPVVINTSNSYQIISNKNDFLTNHKSILFNEFRNDVLIKCNPFSWFENWQGICLGNGHFWVNNLTEKDRTDLFVSVIINNFDFHK